jgi:tetratricopeptide (TPR) repeat protein
LSRDHDRREIIPRSFVPNVSLDRTATLRDAEKLLRQGKLDMAIAEYVRIVDEFPRDWNTGNILGDLYVRAGKIDKAVDQFVRIADNLSETGFLPKAGAVYKKILRIKPDHDHALMQSAEIAGSQGLLVDARAYLNTLLDRRRSRGDQRGVAQIRIRLAILDPADYAARFAAARARIDVDDAPGALRDYMELAAELAANGRHGEAIEALREAALLSPDDEEVRERLLQIYLASGDFARARECASTPAEFKAIASQLETMGHAEEALATLRDAARLDPSDLPLQEHLARAFLERGDLTAAAEYLTIDTAGHDPQLLLMVAEIRVRSGRIDEGLDIARQLLIDDPLRREDVAKVGWNIAEQEPEAGFSLVELAADTAVAESDWPSAAAAIQEFVTRIPAHIPALMRLVEICVDGGLEATMYSAQAQLADAYIAAGSAAEARFIAEDLVAREPWDRANIERFRRALVLMGEPDPDGLIAERLSGHSPFMSTDVSLQGDELPAFEIDAEFPTVPAAEPTVLLTATVADEPSADVPSADLLSGDLPSADLPSTDVPRFENRDEELLALMAISPAASAQPASADVVPFVPDEAPEPEAAALVPPPDLPIPASVQTAASDLAGAFRQPREETGRRPSPAGLDDDLKRGLAMIADGHVDAAIPVLQAASKSPRLRFEAASTLGRLFRTRGLKPQTVEWLERAAEAPAPTADQGHQLLYELAEALEASGDTARALAICIELQAETGNYRDIVARVDRLARVQIRG